MLHGELMYEVYAERQDRFLNERKGVIIIIIILS